MTLENHLKNVNEFVKTNKGFAVTTAILATGSIADVVSTHYGLNQSNLVESSSLGNYLLENYGIASLYLAKGVFVAYCAAISKKISELRYVNTGLGFLYFGATINNIAQTLS